MLEKLVLELQIGRGRPGSAETRSGREVWVEFGETHLYKHLGSVSLGPAGGAQGNKQVWFENLTALWSSRKTRPQQDGVIHYHPPPLTVF